MGKHILIAVSDTGIGIKKATLGRIFDPFFTTKAQGRGTGLGLSTVFGIVKQNKGNIHVYSEPGTGTTFKIYWPAHVTEADLKKQTAKRVQEVAGGSETILLVEDDKDVRDFVSNALEILGYKVIAAKSAQDAIDLVKKNDIDLLFTDVIMPEMSGKELVEKILKMKPQLKILYGSGYTGDYIAKSGVLEDRISFIGKPYTIESLSRKIREVLEHSRE